MNIIRIPSGYHSQLKFLSDEDIAYIFRSLFEVANNEKINKEESMRFGILESIFREASQMNNKARAKKGEKALKIDLATLSRDEGVRPSNITSSNITSEKESENTQKNVEKISDEEMNNHGKESFGEFVKLNFMELNKLKTECQDEKLFNEIVEELNIAIGCADIATVKAKYSNHYFAFLKFLRTKKNSKSFAKAEEKPKTETQKMFRNWLKEFEWIDNIETFAKSQEKLFSEKIIAKALKDQICTDPMNFKKMANYLLKQSKK